MWFSFYPSQWSLHDYCRLHLGKQSNPFDYTIQERFRRNSALKPAGLKVAGPV